MAGVSNYISRQSPTPLTAAAAPAPRPSYATSAAAASPAATAMDVVFEFTRVVVSAVSKRCASAILEVARQNPRYTGKLIEMGQATNRVYVHLKYFSGRVLMPPGTPQYLRSNSGPQLQQAQHHQQVQHEMPQPQQPASAARHIEDIPGGGGGEAAGGLQREASAGKDSFSFFLPFAKAAAAAAPGASPDEAGAAGGAAAGAAGDAAAETAGGAAAGPAGGAAAGTPGGAGSATPGNATAGAGGTTAGIVGGEKVPAPPPPSCSVLGGSSRVQGNSNSVGVCTAGGSSSTCSGNPNTCTFSKSNSSSSLPFTRPSPTMPQQHAGPNTGGQRPPQAKITLSVKPLDEDKALEVGAEALSDGLVMIIMLCLVAIGLYIRRLSAARSEARVRLREEQLRLQYEATQEQLDRIVAFLQQQFPQVCNQSALLASSVEAAQAAVLAAVDAHGEASTTATATTPHLPRGGGSPVTQTKAAAATSEGNVPRKRDAATENKAAAGGSAGIPGRATARPTQ